MPDILYIDNHIIVCVKPSGVLSQSDGSEKEDMLSILKEYIKKKYNKPGNVYLGLVHRLDKDVSGVMVFARTSKAASRLSEEIRSHHFKKKYMCVCDGILEKKEDTWTDYIERCEYFSKISKNGKESTLSYKVINEKDNKSLVDILLLTGRHHQIRVQFASHGHALMGDGRYGKSGKHPLALMCYSLSFIHPTLKKEMTFSIEVPSEGYFKSFV